MLQEMQRFVVDACSKAVIKIVYIKNTHNMVTLSSLNRHLCNLQARLVIIKISKILDIQAFLKILGVVHFIFDNGNIKKFNLKMIVF